MECCVCLRETEAFSLKIGVCAPCKHLMHGDCLLEWCKRQLSNERIPTCPLCRTKLTSYSILPPTRESYEQYLSIDTSDARVERLGIGVHTLHLRDANGGFLFGLYINNDPIQLFRTALKQTVEDEHMEELQAAFERALYLYCSDTARAQSNLTRNYETEPSYDALWQDVMRYIDVEDARIHARSHRRRPFSIFYSPRTARTRDRGFNLPTTPRDACLIL